MSYQITGISKRGAVLKVDAAGEAFTKNLLLALGENLTSGGDELETLHVTWTRAPATDKVRLDKP